MTIPKTLSSFLWHFIKRQPIAFVILFITAMIWSINEVFFPFFLKLIINTLHDFKGGPHIVFGTRGANNRFGFALGMHRAFFAHTRHHPTLSFSTFSGQHSFGSL